MDSLVQSQPPPSQKAALGGKDWVHLSIVAAPARPSPPPCSAGLSIGNDEARSSQHLPQGHLSFLVTQYPSSPS